MYGAVLLVLRVDCIFEDGEHKYFNLYYVLYSVPCKLITEYLYCSGKFIVPWYVTGRGGL